MLKAMILNEISKIQFITKSIDFYKCSNPPLRR